MYSHKWTKMHWWYSLKYFREAELLPHTQFNEILYRHQPPTRPDLGEFSLKQQSPHSLPNLIVKVLNKYPELRYIPTSQISSTAEHLPQNSHILLNFVKKQQELIRKGFTEEKAFEIVEKKYHERMQQKKQDFMLTQGVAINNQARSLMNFYQQQSEYESRLKVLRLERDLMKYEQAVKTFEEKVLAKSAQSDDKSKISREQEIENEEKLLSELRNEELDHKNPHYQRLLEKIMYKSPEKKKADIEQTKENNKEIIKEFLEGSRNVYALYFDLIAMKDRLSGLKDPEIMESLNDSPKKFKQRTKVLRKKLEKFNIKLDHLGEIDVSQSTAPENIKKKLLMNPLTVKIALMGQEMDYEFPHQEHRRELARELREKLENLERDHEQKAQEERDRMNELTFESRDFESYEPLAEKKMEVAKKLQVSDLYENAELLNKASNFRLVETQEEKLFRLEKKFLEARITELEGSDNAPEKVQQEKLPYVKKLASIIDNFRRLKFFMEKEASLEAGKQLFSEYEDAIMPKGMLPVFYEELESYLTQPLDQKFMSKRALIDHSLILKMLTRKEWDEGTLPAHDFEQEHKKMLTSEDSKEFYDDLQQKLKSRALKIERANLLSFRKRRRTRKVLKATEEDEESSSDSELEEKRLREDSDDDKSADEKGVSSLAGVKITSGKEGLDITGVNEDVVEEEEKDEAKFLTKFGEEKFVEEEIEKQEDDFKNSEENIDEEREDLMQFLSAKMKKGAETKVRKVNAPKTQKKK